MLSTCRRDGIGRRVGLKIQWANHPCGFDPRRRHHKGPPHRGRPFVVAKTGLIGIAAAGERAPEHKARGSALGAFAPRRGVGRTQLHSVSAVSERAAKTAYPLRPSSSQNRTHYVGLRFCFWGGDWHRKLCIASLLLLSKSDPLRWAPIWVSGRPFCGGEDGSHRNRRRRRAGARVQGARKCPWGIRPPAAASEERSSIPFPRFPKEPRKLHIRCVLPPLKIGPAPLGSDFVLGEGVGGLTDFACVF